MPLLFFAGKAPGIERRQCKETDQQGQHDGRNCGCGQQRTEKHQKSADHPDPAGKTMGRKPVLFAGQGPRQPDAGGTAVGAFRQNVSDAEKKQAEEDGQDAHNGKIRCKRLDVDHGTDKDRKGGDKPEEDGLGGSGAVLCLFRCMAGEEMQRKHQKREEENEDVTAGEPM